ncbi:GrpB family protein [Saccharopolyspora thermophila]|nr:GrpB family protein [Saccharopolyspora subtropica]
MAGSDLAERAPRSQGAASTGQALRWWVSVPPRSVVGFGLLAVLAATPGKGAVMSSTPDDAAPMSDEELQRITVGERTPHNAPVALVDYDPRWPELFPQHAGRVRSTLGERALQAAHVGSTPVPGPCAKPIIDMVLIVADSSAEPAYVPDLEAAGYVLRVGEPDWFAHRLFKGSDPAVNLHVFSSGAAEVDWMLRFRDWLRANDADRDRYARVERELARRVWRHVQHYAEAKTAVIQEIMDRARPPDEARSTGP